LFLWEWDISPTLNLKGQEITLSGFILSFNLFGTRYALPARDNSLSDIALEVTETCQLPYQNKVVKGGDAIMMYLV